MLNRVESVALLGDVCFNEDFVHHFVNIHLRVINKFDLAQDVRFFFFDVIFDRFEQQLLRYFTGVGQRLHLDIEDAFIFGADNLDT